MAVDLTITNLLPLFAGHPVRFLSEESPVEALADALRERAGFGLIKITPTHLSLLTPLLTPEEAAACARTLVIGADFLPAEPTVWWQDNVPGVRLMNEYGPTETVVGCSAYILPNGVHRAGPVPVGGPIQNLTFFVLDAHLQPVPVGLPGELYIGGAGVARGYLGRPGLSAEKFVPDPFAKPGARMYRTGDRARWLEGGNLLILGRSDNQVKIRGYRVELGEIEAALRRHPDVSGAIVVAREDRPGDRRLVAYVVADAEAAGRAELREHLRRTLPEYMVPSAFVRLDAFPQTPTGKLDHRALPAPEGDAYARGAYEAPQGETEEALAEVWSELLGVERVGRRDNFFELGGHSLLAVQVISRIRQVLGVEVVLGELFARPVLAELARGLKEAGQAALPPIEPVERGDRLPLSFAQQRLWFLERLGSGGAAYHIPVRLRLRGELDRDALGRALDRITARHEALRTTFAEVDGEPVQRIAPAGESAFLFLDHDLREHPEAEAEFRRLAVEEASAPFDLERGPLVRGRLVRLAADDHVLLVTLHHAVSDAWSMGVLTRELGALYGAFRRGEPDPLAPPPIQYADYAAWQRRRVDGEVLREQSEYWKTALAGAPALLELPTDRARPARQDFAGATVGMVLDEELTAGLKALSQRQGTTLFMTLLAGWSAVLGRLSGQEDVVVGTPTANRGRSEIEGLIGFFVNTLALRVDLFGSPTVAELLDRVRERALGAQQRQDIPFEQVVELVQPARSLSHSPLFQVMFTWQNVPGGELELPGLTLAPLGGDGITTAKFDLSLALAERGGRIVGGVDYATALFDRETVERYLGYLHRVLEAMAADARQPVERLSLLSAAERRQVVEEWNATGAAYAADVCIHELFEARAERTPGAVAAVAEDESLTYAELNARSNRLAHHLRGLGVGPDVRVAICLERSLEMVVGLLAILKAGAAYVPVDPGYPADRLRYMLADGAPAVLLTQSPLAGLFGGVEIPVIALDMEASAWADLPETNPERAGLTPDHLAYVIYTSGSTGRPKGVMNAHRGVVNRLLWMQEAYRLDAGEAVLQKTPFSFDVSVWEFFWTLGAGARLVMARPEGHRDPGYLVETIRAAGITTLHFVPSMLQAFLEHPEAGSCAGLARVVCSGEALPRAAARRFHERLPGVALYNLYGPTEAAVDVTAWRCAPEETRASIPIGRPVANTRMYALDARGEPVPAGVAGELYIGGVQVARGYLGRAALTAERFVPDAFGGEAGARLYRTGDVGRWLPDGSIEYLGRTDFQVKVRGFRIELGEIEARLREHASVRETVVLAREDAAGEKRLVAYFAGDAAEADSLRAHLSARLPEYMVPAAYVRLDALPLTPNGKVDRKALPAPEGGAFVSRAYEAPAGETEEALAEIWAELLGVDRVGRWDDFFALGGHSLRAVQVVSRVRQALGVEVALGELFVRPGLAELARGLEEARRAELPPIERADRAAALPLSFAQQRLWFLERLGSGGAAYHIPVRLRLRGELDRTALARALDRIVARHEALRTTVAEVDGEPAQRIAPAGESAFRLLDHDLGEHPDADAELRRLIAEEATAPFDLERGPPVRGRLIRLEADDHVLLVTMHHIVSDGWSMGVLTRELSALYGAFHGGEPDPLPPLPIQYADYAAWQRRWVDGEVLREQSEYWTTTLAGTPELLELPADHPRPARQDFAGAAAGVLLDEALTAGLKALGRRHGTTPFMTLLAGWSVVLGRLSGRQDVVIGTPTANRGRSEIEGLIGLFVNTLALRLDLSGTPTVAELLGRVKERALSAQHHQDIPFEQVVELVQPARSLAHSPLFQVMFTWQNAGESRLELPGLTLAPLSGAARTAARFDLSLTLQDAGGRIAGSMEYATALFEKETVERSLGYLRRVLEAMAADELQRVEALPLLPESERRQVLEGWNATEAASPVGSCLHELFEAQAERTPDVAAVVFKGETLTYAALNARANRLAHHLHGLGVGPDVRVGVCVERGLEMVVGVLGVLKAGGAYVPLDPEYPEDRLRYVLQDSAPAALLTQASLAERFAGVETRVVALDADASSWADQPDANPVRAGLTPDHLAYVIYTSGSTGRPKGVMNLHRGVVNLLWSMRAAVPMQAGERLVAVTTLAFDISVLELFLPLLCGARVEVLARAAVSDPARLRDALSGRGTVLQATPATWRLLVESGWEGGDELRALSGGEALPADLAARVRERVGALWNVYGPTETTIWSSAQPVEPAAAERGPVPIGAPVANTRIYVLDAAGGPVPVGVAGELHIGGAGVARGYLGRAALTAERFVPDAFSNEPGARMYQTGDVGRWSRGGRLEYVGRNDAQVKVRGYRIELGEIEARLCEHPSVRETVVLAREDAPGDRRLVAYVVGDATEAEALRAHLSERLPEYMAPAAYVRLEAMPLTPNGKVDRKALPAPEGDAYAARAYQAPEGETEQALAEIWSDVLQVQSVGRWDNFFDLGGHSLRAVRVVSRIRQALGVEVALGEMFVRPVLADFARTLEAAVRTELPPIEPVERRDGLPLSFAQQRLWFLERLGGGGAAYHIPTRLRLRGELDRGALVRALDRIVARHESLRTTFASVDEALVQRIAPAGESAFRLIGHDLGEHPEAEAELRRLLAEEARETFDLERGPLVRGRLIRLAADDHVLHVTMHHIVSDGWSMGVLTRELSALYGAFSRGEPDPLPALPIQYADYAAWQRRWVDGEVLQAQAEYWKTALAGAPELLELPTDRPRPARQDFAGASVGIILDEDLTTGLRALSRRSGTTLFMTLLAGWAALLGRLSGQDDVVIGTPTANRGRSEIEGLIGFFVNTLPLRFDLSAPASVAELLGQVRARSLGGQGSQDIPFEQVVELVRPARSLAHSPLFQVLFTGQNAGEGRLELPGLTLAPVEGAAQTTAKFDLSLTLAERGGRIVGGADYATALFDGETVERYLGYLRRVLEAMAADDLRSVADLPLLDQAERRVVVEEWNATDAAYASGACIHELFEAQVERTPEAVAVVFEDESLSYAELNARANRLAHHLRALGVGPDTRVAVGVERSPEMVVGLLAVLKAGGAYVPLDPEYPEDRLRHMLADSAPAVLLTQAALEGRFGGVDLPRVCLDAEPCAWAGAPETNPEREGLTPEHLAYVIYTSGSTGRPKGVMNVHRNVVNRLAWGQRVSDAGREATRCCRTPRSASTSRRAKSSGRCWRARAWCWRTRGDGGIPPTWRR
jgi:amino acid adenylation domain-containing protein